MKAMGCLLTTTRAFLRLPAEASLKADLEASSGDDVDGGPIDVPVNGDDVVAAAPRDASPAEAAAAARIGVAGYISCPIPPWDTVPNPGRLTTWPDHKPLAQRSVAVRCYLHSGCTVTKGRSRVTDDLLLKWLFSGEVVPKTATAAYRAAKKAAHLSLFKTMMAESVGSEDAASSV